MKSSELLALARQKLEPKGVWTNGYPFGTQLDIGAAMADVAIEHGENDKLFVALAWLDIAAGTAHKRWERVPSRRPKQVLALFDKAIALALESGR